MARGSNPQQVMFSQSEYNKDNVTDGTNVTKVYTDIASHLQQAECLMAGLYDLQKKHRRKSTQVEDIMFLYYVF